MAHFYPSMSPAPELLREIDPSECDPDVFFGYMFFLFFGWIAVIPVAGIATVLLGVAVAHLTGGHPTSQSWTPVLLFVEIFLLVGGLDAMWRYALAQAARRRYRRAGERVDGATERLMALARANVAAPLLQLLAAIAAVILYT